MTNLAHKQPNATSRTVVLGTTGTGKTVRALHILAFMNWHKMPWVMIDYKEDDLIMDICQLGKVTELKPSDPVPKIPGLYHMVPTPKRDDDAVEDFLWRCHARGNIGLYVDEGYMVDNDAFDTILVQGRSKHIPVIVLYQRPVRMSRFAIAQADFFVSHFQNDDRDIKTTHEFVPFALYKGHEFSLKDDLPEYYALWYTVGQRASRIERPCPSPSDVLAIYAERLRDMKKVKLL